MLERDFLRGNIINAPPYDTVAGMVDDLAFGTWKQRAVYWTDASKRENLGCGIGVVHQTPTGRWDRLSWSVRASTETSVLEIYAVAKALELAGERCRTVEAEQRPSHVLREISYGMELVGLGLLAVEELSVLNIPVEIGWNAKSRLVDDTVREEGNQLFPYLKANSMAYALAPKHPSPGQSVTSQLTGEQSERATSIDDVIGATEAWTRTDGVPKPWEQYQELSAENEEDERPDKKVKLGSARPLSEQLA
ncbi:MAG: hypothetical protein Q9174_002429 [Haloplaca sp. 1 TL-2023]